MNWSERAAKYWIDHFQEIPPRLLASCHVPTDLFPRALQRVWGAKYGNSALAVCPVTFNSSAGGWLVPPVCFEIYQKYVFDKEWKDFSIDTVAMIAVDAFESEMQAFVGEST